ncbi:MAG: 50S ribosomal protein L4, partial [Rickettsiales bacterium]|nr:50S ribosomal protein L4 [Rickettsiales bacterium]
VRDHGYNLQKKVRAMGLKMALSTKALDNKIIILDSVKIDAIKTKTISDKLSNLGIEKPLFITKKDESKNFNASIQNLIYTDVIPVEGANVYDILKHKTLLITVEALNGITERLAKYPTTKKAEKPAKIAKAKS